jgi:hypothetical protein
VLRCDLLMAVNAELLKILVCPLCKAPVNLTESGQGLNAANGAAFIQFATKSQCC